MPENSDMLKIDPRFQDISNDAYPEMVRTSDSQPRSIQREPSNEKATAEILQDQNLQYIRKEDILNESFLNFRKPIHKVVMFLILAISVKTNPTWANIQATTDPSVIETQTYSYLTYMPLGTYEFFGGIRPIHIPTNTPYNLYNMATGQVAGLVNLVAGYGSSTLMHSATRFTVYGLTVSAKTYDITQSAGVVTFTAVAAMTQGTIPSHNLYFRTCVIDASAYIYCQRDTGSSQVVIHKRNLNSITTAGPEAIVYPNVVGNPVVNSKNGLIWLGSLVVGTFAKSDFSVEGMFFIETVGMTFVKVLQAKANGYIVEAKASTGIYFITNANSANGYGAMKATLAAPSTLTVLSSITTTYQPNNLKRSDHMGIVIMTYRGSGNIDFVNIHNMAVTTLAYGLATIVADRTLTWGKMTAGRQYFAYCSWVGPSKIQYGKQWLDFCQVQGEDPCVACQPGRYLNNANSENLCLAYEDFPARYGINGNYMEPCLGDLALGCLTCPTASAVCTICDNGSGFYLSCSRLLFYYSHHS